MCLFPLPYYLGLFFLGKRSHLKSSATMTSPKLASLTQKKRISEKKYARIKLDQKCVVTSVFPDTSYGDKKEYLFTLVPTRLMSKIE